MALHILLENPAPPPVVLAAIQDQMREWRESVIPEELRARGVVQVAARVRGPRFRLRYELDRRRWAMPAVRGAVVEGVGGGSRVEAVVGLEPSEALGPGLFAALGLWLVLTGASGGWLPVVVGAVIGGVLVARHEGMGRGNPEVDYLVARLTAAVAVPASARTPADAEG